MPLTRDIQNYETSRDYERLWELAQEQSVVCFMDSLIERTRMASMVDPGTVNMNQADFIAQCRRRNVAWIVPHGLKQPEPPNAEHEGQS